MKLTQTKQTLLQQITATRNHNHAAKLSLWELKNQILELKNILNDEQEEARRLEEELHHPSQDYYTEQDEE